jgi:hypothetical protein
MIYLFVYFLPIKFNKAYLIGEYSTNETNHRKEFPLKMKLVFFNQVVYLSIGKKKEGWKHFFFNMLMRQIDRNIYIVQ